MSGYVRRVAMHGLATGETRSLEPFVRSASPVFDHDQRVGMAEFEGIELPQGTPEQGAQESILGADEFKNETEFTTQPLIQTDRNSIQSKILAPVTDGIGLSQRVRSWDLDSSVEEHATNSRTKPAGHAVFPPSGEIDGTANGPLNDVNGDWAASEALSFLSETHRETVHPPERDSARRIEGIVHARAARINDPSLLQPALRFSSADTVPVPADPNVTAAAENARVVIGRINVEVLPPAVQATSTAPFRPLTAASVSMIGPLNRGVRVNRRLGLRHR